jgi:hypothetical protein
MLLVADCQRIFEKLLWDPAGRCMESVLERLALTDPGKLATIVAERCLHKPSAGCARQPRSRRMARDGRSGSADQASAPDGATALPTDIAPALEETVRAHFAKPIAE